MRLPVHAWLRSMASCSFGISQAEARGGLSNLRDFAVAVGKPRLDHVAPCLVAQL